jgi:hypothetical protein
MNSIWEQKGAEYRVGRSANYVDKLPVAIYSLLADEFGALYLEKQEDAFGFPFRIYGMEKEFVGRTLATYSGTKGNLGILLNGIKGTGKTVTAKMIANSLKLPIILIGKDYPNTVEFMNAISQDAVFFFDEFEKVFQHTDSFGRSKSSKLLTIMDGVLTSSHRKIFLLTTNDLQVEVNLLQRPGRVRYLKTFGNLSIEHIMEIVDDLLVNKAFRDDVIKFISQLELITVDIVTAVISETNIHNQSPEAYAGVFNVKKMDARFDVWKLEAKPKTKVFKGSKEAIFKAYTHVQPREISEKNIGDNLFVNAHNVGRITEIQEGNIIVTEVEDYDDDSQPIISKNAYRIEQIPAYHSSFAKYIDL